MEPVFQAIPSLMQPLVSIVIPTYNRADRLPKALQSCLRQTYRNLEVIVVDDGSTDETSQVVAAFRHEDPRIRYHRQQNQKLPAALNAGFRISRGEYLTWTSDDNLYHVNAIEVMVKGLEENRDVGLVYCGCILVDAAGHIIRREELRGPECLPEYNSVGACFMYRRRVYEEVGDYDPAWLYVEDYDYWLRVQKRFKLAQIPDVSPYSRTWHDQSLTLQLGPRQCLLGAKLQLRHARSWKKISIFIRTREHVASAYAELGDWHGALLACVVFALGEPWRRWKWLHSIKVVRAALKARTVRRESAIRPTP
jgi:glycosyltransferase involved in cell wall biosynthesis